MNPQPNPWPPLRDLDAESAKTLFGLAADVVLLLDDKGTILDLACDDDDGLPEGLEGWIGKDWLQTVSPDSRDRLVSLLSEASGHLATRWIQVRHPSTRGADTLIQYRAVAIGKSGRILVVGRELQAVASLQQQLVDAQQTLERDYWRYREMETRYRLLFRMVSEGTLILEGSTLSVVEANPAAEKLLGHAENGVVGRPFVAGFDKQGTAQIKRLLAHLVAGAEPQVVRARHLADGRELLVAASLIRQGKTSLYLLRITPATVVGATQAQPVSKSEFDKAVESAPDCILVTDSEGRLSAANPAFFELAQLPRTQQVKGESLDRWLGRSGVDLRVLFSNLEKYGTLRLFRTVFRGEIGATTEAEVSAARIEEGDRLSLSFFVRDIGRRLSGEQPSSQSLPMWLEALTERVGHAPLKDLVRESTEQIERLCIEAALRLTGENRASAAELLGLSRQSLYVKLARYGLGTNASDNGS